VKYHPDLDCEKTQKRFFDSEFLTDQDEERIYKCAGCTQYFRDEECERHRPSNGMCICYGCEEKRTQIIDEIIFEYPRNTPVGMWNRLDQERLKFLEQREYFPLFYDLTQRGECDD